MTGCEFRAPIDGVALPAVLLEEAPLWEDDSAFSLTGRALVLKTEKLNRIENASSELVTPRSS